MKPTNPIHIGRDILTNREVTRSALLAYHAMWRNCWKKAVAQLLEIVYEPIYKDLSYGFKPERNCHQAIKKVISEIQTRKVSFIVEVVIQSFFDTLNHDMVIQFLEHDIADKKFTVIVKRLLKAGA